MCSAWFLVACTIGDLYDIYVHRGEVENIVSNAPFCDIALLRDFHWSGIRTGKR